MAQPSRSLKSARRKRGFPLPYRSQGAILFLVGSLLTQTVNFFFLLGGESRTDLFYHSSPSPAKRQVTLEKRAIFYNVFIPPTSNKNGTGPHNALRIVKEQLQQIQKSALRDAPVYYTLIGLAPNQTRGVLDNGNPNLHLLQHLPEGQEQDTLQALYEYCLQQPSQQDNATTTGGSSSSTAHVSYIHDKGSFHRNAGNEIRRQYATKSALSEACHAMPTDTCNVCVFDFYLTPHHHAGANMWTADCNYIAKLIPPILFDAKMRQMYDELFHRNNNNNNSTLVPSPDYGEGALSIGRFAMEHWVFSHPHVRPCETLGNHLSYAKVRTMEPWGWTPTLGKKISNTRFFGIFKEPWFQQEGRLYQYHYLYQQDPPKDSWFWYVYQKHKMTTTTTHPETTQFDKSRTPCPHQRLVLLSSGPVQNITRHLPLQKKERLGSCWTFVDKSLVLQEANAMDSTTPDQIPSNATTSELFLKIQNSWKQGRSIVLDAELLDSLLILSDSQTWTGLFPKNVHVTVMYQTPRSSHLLSVYEKDTLARTLSLTTKPIPLKGNNGSSTMAVTSLSEWLCHGDSVIVEKLVATQLHPMGVADAFVRHYENATVTIADIQLSDVPSQVACEIFQVVPCNSDTVTDTQQGIMLPPGMRNSDFFEIETILRQMDCHSYCGLRGNVTVHYKKDVMFTDKEGWNQCCSFPEKSLSPSEAYTALQNVGCRAMHRERNAPTEQNVMAEKEMWKRVADIIEPAVTSTSLQVQPDLPPPPRGVVVLGMHRSGTSLLSGLLVEGFGFTVGGPLLQAKGENAKGYYERRDVVLENMNLLKRQGAHWHRAVEKYNASVPLTLGDKGQRALEFMRTTTEQNSNTSPPWLIKDPRLCITLPTWRIQQPAIVFTYRHPIQVASSLQERDVPFERGLELWIVYNKRAIQNSQHLCRVVSSNSAILANPLEESTRIVRELVQKCHLRRPPGRVTREVVDRFVDLSLQHHTDEGGCQDLEGKGDMYRMAMKVYCDLVSHEAYKPDYKWPIGVDGEGGQGLDLA